MKTIEEHNAEQEEIERRKREELDDCPPADCQGDEPVRTESRYKRGRRWWEQSKWERRH